VQPQALRGSSIDTDIDRFIFFKLKKMKENRRHFSRYRLAGGQ